VTVNADTPRNAPSVSKTDRAVVSYLTLVESAKTSTKTEGGSVENPEIPKAPAEQARNLIDAFERAGADRFKVVFLSAVPVAVTPAGEATRRGRRPARARAHSPTSSGANAKARASAFGCGGR